MYILLRKTYEFNTEVVAISDSIERLEEYRDYICLVDPDRYVIEKVKELEKFGHNCRRTCSTCDPYCSDCKCGKCGQYY